MAKLLSPFVFLILVSSLSLAQGGVLPDSLFIIQDVFIPTKSGVPISATVVRKKENTAPLPVVLFYTTYHQGPQDVNLGKRPADRDFVGVVAYARGIKTELKRYAPYENEATDIYDIIDWISKQSWCDGQVGMMGGSYTGFSQWAAVKKLHPALKTIVPQVAVMPGFDTPMENNVPIGNILSWPHEQIYKFPRIGRHLLFEWFENGSSFRSMDSLAGHPNPIFQKWLSHPAYDAYWQSMVPTPAEYAKINLPVLSTTGYYDGSQLGALRYFKLHGQHNPNANHYFVIGPYDHWGGQRNAAKNLMGYDIDPVANISMRDLAYEWLDHILKSKAKPVLLKDKVNYQVMGTNAWKHAPSLTAMNKDTLSFYFNKTLLEPKKPKRKSFITQKVDFNDREIENSYYTPAIVFDTLDIGNGLVFSTKPFDREFIYNGSFTGNLVLTTNKKDLDISLALYELRPDGKYFYLTRYVGRASYARDNSTRKLLRSNHKETIPIGNTRWVSKKILKGSKIVALLNINKHPFEVINYGSGKDVNDETIKDAGEPMEIKWHNESFLRVPVEAGN